MERGKYDDIFLQIAGQVGDIESLLDEFFGFLSRKTDFYVEYSSNERATMGFPPGINEKMVINSFKKYPIRHYQSEITSSNNSNSNNITNSSLLSSSSPLSSSSSSVIKTESSSSQSNLSRVNIEEVNEEKNKKSSIIRLSETGSQIPIGNGGIADKYYWTQTLKEITVYIDLDFRVKGKEVQCNITPSHLTLSVKGETLLNDNFEDKVCVSESMWVISSDCHESENVLSQIIITLDKSRKTWWKHVLINDPEIDTTKVDSTQKISEYDDETQAAIRKIMFEQKQKRLSGQLESYNDIIPSEAYTARGSPFLQNVDNHNHNDNDNRINDSNNQDG